MDGAAEAVNTLLERILRVACPKCGAAASERCIGLTGTTYSHIERSTAVPVTPLRYVPREAYARGSNPSRMCGHYGNHSKCSGYHRRNHGMNGELCTCGCHIERRKNEG